jgi:hypothetical protein
MCRTRKKGKDKKHSPHYCNTFSPAHVAGLQKIIIVVGSIQFPIQYYIFIRRYDLVLFG